MNLIIHDTIEFESYDPSLVSLISLLFLNKQALFHHLEPICLIAIFLLFEISLFTGSGFCAPSLMRSALQNKCVHKSNV
jgi:hypothetical protein